MNTSAAPELQNDTQTIEAAPPTQTTMRIPRQTHLFPAERPKVIAFDSIAARRAPVPANETVAPSLRQRKSPGTISATRSGALAGTRNSTIPGQQTLEFLQPAPTPDDMVQSDAPVASMSVRCAAAAIDAWFVIIGAALFLVTFHLAGGQIALTGKASYGFLGAGAALTIFYHLFWCVLKCETPGMRQLQVRVVNFDGRPADARQRVIRWVTGCLGLCAAGVGLIWALFDEEKLAWHDHISQTFPTVSNTNSGTFHRG